MLCDVPATSDLALFQFASGSFAIEIFVIALAAISEIPCLLYVVFNKGKDAAMLVAQQLRRKFGAAALQIAGFIMKSKFPLVVVRRRLWEFPTMACFEQWYKVKGEENCGTLKVSLLLIRSEQLLGVGQAHLSAPDDISHWFVAGAK